MSDFFTPYEGKRPCLFVSYAHKTSGQVIPAIRLLYEQGYRLWYDEGIPAGADWPKNVAAHMRRCEAVLFFISEPAMRSSNCFNEISAARAQRKTILTIALDGSPLPDRWAGLLEGAALAIPPNTEPEGIAQSVLRSGFLVEDFLREPGEVEDSQSGEKKARRYFWLFALLLSLLLLAAAAGMFSLYMGWFPELLPGRGLTTSAPAHTLSPSPAPTPVPTPAITPNVSIPPGMFEILVKFPDAQQEKAVRAAINLPEGEIYLKHLVSVHELLFCGSMNLKSAEGIRIGRDGGCRVNGAPVVRGKIADLSTLGRMPALTSLSLIYQRIVNISSLKPLIYLRELNLSLNPLEDLGNVSSLVSLTTLHVEYTNVKDLSPLHALQRLETVTVSADMFPLIIGNDAPQFDLILVP